MLGDNYRVTKVPNVGFASSCVGDAYMAHLRRTFISKSTPSFQFCAARIRSIEGGSGKGHTFAVVPTATSGSATVDLPVDSARCRSARIQICSAFATAGRSRVSPWSR